ncbi:MAG: PorP/SprF family type IX secretion system membrane protein [Crocinitomicaceae bacterium]|nr:PorP/SprF family type IX secretion system membrane protein [Crocinitomicaceae bacterium]
MKHLVTFAFLMASLFSFGQSNLYWNNYSNFNPAMSGFQYNQHASATYNNSYPSLSGGYAGLLTDVGVNIANHHGVGIAYTGDYTKGVNSHKAVLNYNYQFYFKKAGKLAFGAGAGVGHTAYDYNKLTFGDFTVLPEPKTNLELNAGVAYNWRNLYVGFSATNLTPSAFDPINAYYYSPPRTQYHVQAQYAFQIAKKFQLTPRVLYTYHNGFQRLQPNLTLTYNQKFSLGVSSRSRDGLGVNVGWDIANKFRVAYMFSATVSKLSNGVNGGVHDFTFSYLLKNKPVIGDDVEKPKL